MNLKVVVADDDTITRMDLKERLQLAGYDVIGDAADGFDAIEICKEKKPDIVLLDVKMPIMDGITSAKMIHEVNEEIAIVMVTAYNDKTFIQKAGEFGAVGYVVKPVEEKYLLPVLEIAATRHSEIVNLKKELRSQEKKIAERKMVEKAKGILMKQNNISEDESYQYLRSVSMNKRKSMQEIAEVIVEGQKFIK